ncbi:MAG: metal-dependent transcriptional regulator [Victivallales bacterium]|nr:metal-dependent transcriptional regulator [Victivallales bacterium]
MVDSSRRKHKKPDRGRKTRLVVPSLPLQSYVKVIDDITRDHGHAHAKAIAAKLGISMPSVTEALRNLSGKGFVTYCPRMPVTLTRQGQNLAQELRHRHKILAEFFTMIGCGSDLARQTACIVEHQIDAEIARLIEKHMQETAAGGLGKFEHETYFPEQERG